MKADEEKTREELIGELQELRRQTSRATQPDNKEIERMEADLRESEARYRTIAESTLEGIWMIGNDNRTIYANNRMADMLGYSQEEMIGLSVFEFVRPENIGEMKAKREERNLGKTDFYEFPFVRKDGSDTWLRVSAQPVIDGEGRVSGAFGMFMDVNEQRRTLALMQASESRYRQMFETIRNAVVVYKAVDEGEDFIIHDFNPAAEAIEGVRKADILGRSVLDVFPGVREFGLFDVLQKVWRTGQSEYYPVSFYQDSRISGWRDNNVYKLPTGEVIAIYEDITSRKQDEEKLKENEEILQIILNAVNESLFMTRADGTVIAANPVTAHRLGMDEVNLRGRCIYDLLPPEVASNRRKYFDIAAWSGRPVHFEDEKNGRFFEHDIYPIQSKAARQEQRFVILEQDITKRKIADQKLQGQYQFLQTLMDTIPTPIFYKDREGVYLGCNKAFAEFNGRTKEEIVGKSVYEMWAKEFADIYYRADTQLLQNPGVQIYEASLLHADGTAHSVIFYKATFNNQDGTLGGLIGSFLDIEERMQAETALKANEARLRAVFDSVQDFIFIKDANRRYLVINSFFQRRFQVDPSVFIGHTDAEIPIFENKEMTGEIIKDTDALVLQGETAHYELRHLICGNLLTFDIMKTPIRDGQGNITGICGLSRDITERHRMEEEKRSLEERLQRAEKMESLGLLAGGVAHDLNNVLGIVVGYAEMLLDEIDASSPMRDDLIKILDGGNRSAAIVQDLLTLARRGVQTKKVVNLNAAISDFHRMPEFEKMFSYNRRVKLTTDLEADLLNIMGSSLHLGKTVINLVSNAVEAMRDGGTVTIRTSNLYLDRPILGYDNVREGDYVVLAVSDTGEGIPERDIKRIFEPFYTKKVMGRSGTGLGLAVVWGTVKDHNGYINVESEEGKGTTFTLYFPVTREEIAGDLISVSMSEYMGKGETIMVVDDIKGQRDLASRMLTKLNYVVNTVASGEEAVEYVKTKKTDLIVLDMIMDPGMDGLETYKKVLEINPLQKAIIVSGFSESDQVKEAQRLGAGDYVRKPYVLERLGMAVRDELDRKQVGHMP